MKNWIPALIIIIAVIGIGLLLEFRYALIVDAPVVVKLDRLTGNTWIVNSGVWRKIHPHIEDMVLPAESQPVTNVEKKAR